MGTFLVTYKEGACGIEYSVVFTTEDLESKIEKLKDSKEDFRLVDVRRL